MKSFDALSAGAEEVTGFREEPIPHDLIANLLQNARIVKGSFHLEPTNFFVYTTDTEKEKIWKASFKQPLIRKAPCIVIFTGDRQACRDLEVILDQELEANSITVDEAERLRQAVTFHFDTSPLGMGWIAKFIGAPLMRLFTSMPRLPAVYKREWLIGQVMRQVMTFFWSAESHDLSVKLVDSFDEWRLKLSLSIPWNHVIVAVALVGYGEEKVKLTPQIPLDEILHWNK